ncbi:MAG: 4-hydroxybenzoyl-CoA reductase subunit beta, partial [Planctomycetota bacterium]
VAEALALLAEHGEDALLIAGGTDLVPNMKHELFTPKVVISLQGIDGLNGIRKEGDSLVIGAMTSLDVVAANELVLAQAPALAQAASLIAGPQLRRMGTLGGNVMLDTRCQWYNQTYFWRSALGFCMKKDGTVCHVVQGGSKCVAAASNDSAPALMTLGAHLVFEGSAGQRTLPIDELWVSDGIYNKSSRGEVLTEIRIPRGSANQRGAYGKLRERGSIDFPMLGIAVRLSLSPAGAVEDADICAVALQAKPTRLKGVAELLRGKSPGTADFVAAVELVAQLAKKRLRPLENIPGDAQWRQAMTAVYTRRTLLAAADNSGPVHHI